MFVYTELQPHLIFLIIMLVLCWSLATWLTWQSRKQYCVLIPQFNWISRFGLFTGTFLMIFSLWFLSLFYGELRLGMTIIFAAIMVGIGSYLARFFEWLVFMQEINKGYWNTIIIKYYYKEYGNGLGPKGTEKILESMLPRWWIEILPKSDQNEIKNTLSEIRIKSDEYAKKREDSH